MANPTSLVAKPILDDIIKTTLALIKETYSSVRGVKKEVENLSSKLTAIKAVLVDAENKQENNQQLKDWLGKLKKAAFDAEDILETFAAEAYHWKKRQTAVRNSLPSLGKVSSKYDTAQKIKDISKKFDTIAEEKNKFHLVNIQDNGGRPETPIHTGPFVDKSDVVGREGDKDRIIQMLLSNEFDEEGEVCVIPITGMGGLGKTTLAQLVFNEVSKDHFNPTMWVCITPEFDLTRILKEMIQFHSKMKLEDCSTSLLQLRLQDILRGKRFLLVLDDVWTEDISKWYSLRVLLKQGKKGSRVLVTSRSIRVGEIVGTQPSYRLQYLPENECQFLFAKIAFGNIGTTLSSEKREELEEIGREIVRKCQGLPLAVKAMGGLLRGHIDVNKWQQIQRNEIWEIENQNPAADTLNVMGLLKLSYNHLPSYLKRCFEYCSLFPKSHVFYKAELVKLWMAEGFIESLGRDTMEETGIAYFSELLMRSFFQPSSIDNNQIFNMHDLMHDLATSISSPNYCQVKDNEFSFSEHTRHVSLLGKDVKQPMLAIVKIAQKLRTLLLPNGHMENFGQALDKVFNTLKYMRGLDLSSTQIKELPDSIKELKLLRYLDLSRTEIRLLPNSICNLFNLQTLKLLGCIWLSSLPQSMGNLADLRYLELDDMFWLKLSRLPPSMGNLTNLHNLPVFHVGDEEGYEIEQLEKMVRLSGTLHISKLEKAVNAGAAKLNEKKSLDKLVFEWSNRVVHTQDQATENSVLERLEPHSNLKKLQILRYGGNEFPAWMREGGLQNLVSLTLNGCLKCKTLDLGDQLPNLRELYIKGMQELEKWTEVECYSLRLLKLSNCPELRELPDIFPILDYLKIKRCNSLRALPVVPYLQILILIDNLILEDWHEVNIVMPETATRRPSLIEVSELKVISYPKLQALPQNFNPKKLEIHGCELLTTLPPPHHAQRLEHLALDASRDGELVRAMLDPSSLHSLVISNIFSLPKWPGLPGLKALYIRDCKHLVFLSDTEEGSLQTLTSLKLLSIRNCEKLETLNEELPTSLECLIIASCPLLKSFSLNNLPSLTDLYIEDCPLLQSLPKDGLPNSLQHLLIQTCPLLSQRCQKEGEGGRDWPKIEHIPDLEIDNYHIVLPTSPVANRPAWYRQYFLCCRGIDTIDIGGAKE
ncbi:putative disease resistance protein RGA4 [Corylus avellana]|uniref:putative disease resistance protein RGA4 n=1 Tax=Corylus avellana TaxID=13451 RepID=UPI00286D0FC1|nr:putative disease resistance protein RGA4 [Corylus avellana]